MKTWHGYLGYMSSLIAKWFSWLQGQCPLSVRARVCGVYKSLAPLMLYAGALVVVILYALADQLHGFVCRIFIPQYDYPYITPFALIQVLLNVLVLLGLHSLGVVRINPFSWRLAERLLVPAVCGGVQCVLALWSRASAHSGLYPLIGRLLPLFSLAWGHLLGVKKSNSIHFTCLLTAITFTSIAITVYNGVYNMEPLEYFYSPLSLLLHSLSLAWLSKVARLERGHTNIFDLYYNLTVTQSVLLVLLCIMHPDTSRAVTDGNWHNLLFLGYMLAVLLLGSGQIFLVNLTALRYSPLTAALLHSARELVKPLISSM
ncbi:uncharacterized protein Hap1MRO34_015172 [Clarias gariepinus]